MFEQVKEFLWEYIEDDSIKIEINTELSDLGIDSLKLCQMIAGFEKRFNVKVSDKQVGELFTVEDLVNIAERRK